MRPLTARPCPRAAPPVANEGEGEGDGSCWLAVRGAAVRGVGCSIEEARAAFIDDGLSFIETPERAADAFGEIPERLSDVVPEPEGYVRLSGPAALVSALAALLAAAEL